MKTTLNPILLFICIATLIFSCKKSDFLDKEISKSLLTSTTPVRYRDSVFANVDSFPNVFYRTVQNYNKWEELKLDVYMPAADTVKLRACIIYIHGGAFAGGTRKKDRAILLNLAKRGYTVISPSYRLGRDWKAGQSRADSAFKYYEAYYRATQDARAMLRFVKKNALVAKIDTTKIFIGGESAGAGTAMHATYLSQDELGNVFSSWGPLDGTGMYDYPGYNSKVKGVLNVAGAIFNKNYIDAGDPPTISAYGTEDILYTDTIESNSPYTFFANGQIIHQRFNQLNILTPPIILYPGKDHAGFLRNPALVNDAINKICVWVHSLL